MTREQWGLVAICIMAGIYFAHRVVMGVTSGVIESDRFHHVLQRSASPAWFDFMVLIYGSFAALFLAGAALIVWVRLIKRIPTTPPPAPPADKD